MIYPVAQPLRFRLRRMWRNTWPAGTVLLLVLALCALAVWSLGCTRADQQRALTVMTETVSAAVPTLRDLRDAEELACLDGEPTFATAKACVVASRAKWDVVWRSCDLLVAIDTAAIDGTVDLGAAVRAYCAVASVASLPVPPMGVCP